MIPVAVILGGAWNVFDDVKALEEIVGGAWTGYIIATNEIGEVYEGRIHHWATCHTEPQRLGRWQRTRIRRGLPGPWETWTHIHGHTRWVDHYVPEGRSFGTSGLFAGRDVAHGRLNLRVVWCGCPMTREPHFDESSVHNVGEPWLKSDHHFEAWKADAEAIRGYGRSMSGRTMELLGTPTREWIYGDDQG